MAHYRMSSKRMKAVSAIQEATIPAKQSLDGIDSMRLSDDLSWIRDAIHEHWAEHPLPNREQIALRLMETLTYCAQAGHVREMRERDNGEYFRKLTKGKEAAR